MKELMKDGESVSAALGTTSELAHRCRESCDFSFTEREQPPRDILPQEFSQLNAPNFYRVNRLLVTQDAVFWDVRCDFLRFRYRTDPLVIIELFRSWVLFFLQEDKLRVEEESAFFRQLACRPLNCENVKSSKQRPPLPSSYKGDECVRIILSSACGAWDTQGTPV